MERMTGTTTRSGHASRSSSSSSGSRVALLEDRLRCPAEWSLYEILLMGGGGATRANGELVQLISRLTGSWLYSY